MPLPRSPSSQPPEIGVLRLAQRREPITRRLGETAFGVLLLAAAACVGLIAFGFELFWLAMANAS